MSILLHSSNCLLQQLIGAYSCCSCQGMGIRQHCHTLFRRTPPMDRRRLVKDVWASCCESGHSIGAQSASNPQIPSTGRNGHGCAFRLHACLQSAGPPDCRNLCSPSLPFCSGPAKIVPAKFRSGPQMSKPGHSCHPPSCKRHLNPNLLSSPPTPPPPSPPSLFCLCCLDHSEFWYNPLLHPPSHTSSPPPSHQQTRADQANCCSCRCVCCWTTPAWRST